MVIDNDPIPIPKLEGFYWVARTGGYAKAARAFPYPITQPGVFAQVRKLEEALGVKLFRRVAKDEVSPTREGRALYAFCAPFIERLPHVVRSLRNASTGGELRIAAGALETITLLPRWIREVRNRHPTMTVRVREIEEPDYGALLRGEVDLVVEVQPKLPREVESRAVATYQPFLIVFERHPLAKRKGHEISVRDFRGERFVAFDAGTRQRELQLAPLAAAGVEVDVVASASTSTALIALVGAGLGISIVVWPERPPKFDRVRFIPLRGRRGDSLRVDAAFRKGAERDDPIVVAALACLPAATVKSSRKGASR